MDNRTINGTMDQGNRPEVLKKYLDAIDSGNDTEIQHTSNDLKDYIKQKVNDSINKFYQEDKHLLDAKMNEVCVTGRLAIYLQKAFDDFSGYYVDIEYYRLKVPISEVRNLRTDRIRCDILLHSRGKQSDSRKDNLLAIEAKLENNPDNGESDRLRLSEFMLPKANDTPKDAICGTLVGLFLKFGNKKPSITDISQATICK